MIVVQKYGGTSLGTHDKLLKVASIIKKSALDYNTIVVVSAMSGKTKAQGVTSTLLKIAALAIRQMNYKELFLELKEFHINMVSKCLKEKATYDAATAFIDELFVRLEQFFEALTIIRELSPLSSDRVLRVGEKLSAMILSQILKELKLDASYVDLSNIAPKNFSYPNKGFYKGLEANLKQELEKLIKVNKVPVLTGFMGEMPGGIMKSVGRGYTDYTSAITASVMQATELQIWKEVDGIFSADPKLVKEASILPFVTTSEAAELSYFGSEVIHPFTMERVSKDGIAVRIKNTLKPQAEGTLITDRESKDNKIIKSITTKRNITILHIRSNRMLLAYGFMAKIFRIFEEHGVVIDLISTSEVSVSLTIAKLTNLDIIHDELKKIGEITIHRNRTILSVVGQKMRETIGIAGGLFSCLSENGINIEMISQGASEINISCVIKDEDANKALQSIHKHFIELKQLY